MSQDPNWPDGQAHETYAYLTTVGRSSGKSHRIEIWFAAEGGRVYLLSGGRDRSDWIRNLMANPVVTFEIGDEKRTGVAHILETGTASDQRARALLVQKYQKTDELLEWGRKSLGVVIHFGTNQSAT
jgi:deazaflavin-dependent oxidoreductase (nitroreductase family)